MGNAAATQPVAELLVLVARHHVRDEELPGQAWPCVVSVPAPFPQDTHLKQSSSLGSSETVPLLELGSISGPKGTLTDTENSAVFRKKITELWNAL